MADADWVQERKAQVYETLLGEVGSLEADWQALYDDPVWEDQTRLDKKIVKLDDPAIYERVQDYLDARETCLDILDEVAMYAEQLQDEFREDVDYAYGSGGGTFRWKIRRAGGGPKREYEVPMDEVVGDHGDELTGIDSAEDFVAFVDDASIYGFSKLEDHTDDYGERLWSALEEDPERGITAFASRFNLFYAELLQEAEQLDRAIERQLEEDLEAALADEGDVPGYAS